MKKRRIIWENVFYGIITLICYVVLVCDIYTITIHSWLSNEIAQFNALGLLTFTLALIASIFFTEYFIYFEKINKKKTTNHHVK